MGHVNKTPAGTYRANWRDPAGQQKARTFKTKKEASAYLSEIEDSLNKGTYLDPRKGKLLFRQHAQKWLEGRHVETRTHERTQSILRNHVLPKWRAWPLAKIDHLSVQAWVNGLASRLSPASVAKCFSTLSSVLASSVRARLIPFNPCDGVRLPSTHRSLRPAVAIDREDFFTRLLPAVPPSQRPIVALAGGAGLRWGECAGLAWRGIDFERKTLRVVQVVIETEGLTSIKPYPKSRAGVRTVPMPEFLVTELLRHKASVGDALDLNGLVVTSRAGTALIRSNFRRDVWRPSLVRAGLLGEVVELGPDKWCAAWLDVTGLEWTKEFTTERDAVEHITEHAAGGLRFHDLRHSYATWLATDGVPVNILKTVMGHESASTTLNLYTHAPSAFNKRVRDAFDPPADDSLTN